MRFDRSEQRIEDDRCAYGRCCYIVSERAVLSRAVRSRVSNAGGRVETRHPILLFSGDRGRSSVLPTNNRDGVGGGSIYSA